MTLISQINTREIKVNKCQNVRAKTHRNQPDVGTHLILTGKDLQHGFSRFFTSGNLLGIFLKQEQA